MNGAHPSLPVAARIKGPAAKPPDHRKPKMPMVRPRDSSTASRFTQISQAV
jgi:hypothetical protein